MANWCFNTLILNGRCKNFEKQMRAHDYTNLGFEFVKDGRCMFSLEEQGDGIYSFESKWAPPIEELVKRAKKGRFSFQLDYEEMGMTTYGRAYYEDGCLEVYNLGDETFDRVGYDDVTGHMLVDGLEVESESEFLEEELEKLIKLKRGNG